MNDSIGMKLLTKEAIEAGKSADNSDPNYTDDPTDYTIWTKYPNLQYFKESDFDWPTQVTITAGHFNTTYTITHNLGYIPQFDLWFKALNGELVHIPGKSSDAVSTSAIISSKDENTIVVAIGSASAMYALDTIYDIFHWIYLNPNEV